VGDRVNAPPENNLPPYHPLNKKYLAPPLDSGQRFQPINMRVKNIKIL